MGQSDDVALLANSVKALQALLHLSKLYCDKYQVKLVAAKTKLLSFTTKETEMMARVDCAVNTIAVDGAQIIPSSQATHVGVVRSVVGGNSHHIVARLAAHRGAMYGLQHVGLAKGHRANPYASLRVEAVYGLPVLLSGLASLVLSSKEEQMLDQQYKVHIQRLLRLHQATPAPVVFFLAGCLPFLSHLHLRIFSLFGQLCRLRGGDNILAARARVIYSSASPSTKSWFWKLRQLCLQYGLPHPTEWLSARPSKSQVKSMTRSAVLQHSLDKMRKQADTLPSLQYMQTRFLGLTRCHPLYRSCKSSPWELEKATTQARLLSGRFRVEALTGHWVPWNRQGLCSLPDCWNTAHSHKGTVESFLMSCPSLANTRAELHVFQSSFLQTNPGLANLVRQCLAISAVQFWLDCSTMAPVITAVQLEGESVLFTLFKLTRNYCHVLHKARQALLSDN